MRSSPRTECAQRKTLYMHGANKQQLEWSWRVISCCLLPQCEALCAYRLGFAIATKWCCDQDVKVVPGTAFTQRTCNWCSCKKGRDVVATTPLALCCSSQFTTKGMCTKKNTICVWCEQAIIEWLWRVISIVACANSAKFCVLAAWAFRLQHRYSTLASGRFQGFSKKTPKHMWLCAGIFPVRWALQTW